MIYKLEGTIYKECYALSKDEYEDQDSCLKLYNISFYSKEKRRFFS